MNAQRQSLSQNNHRSDAWEKVVRWPDLSAANKLAWMFLWTKSREGMQQITTTTTEIGEAQGVSGGAVDKRFSTLVDSGLVEVVRKHRGLYTLQLAHPSEVAIARGLVIPLNGQRVFQFFEADDESVQEELQATSRSGATEATAAVQPPADALDVRSCAPGTEARRPPPANERPPDPPATLRLDAYRSEVPTEEPPEEPPKTMEEPPISKPSKPSERFTSLTFSGTSLNLLPSPSKEGLPLRTTSAPEVPPTSRGTSGGSSEQLPGWMLDDMAKRVRRMVDCPKMYWSTACEVAELVLTYQITAEDFDQSIRNLNKACERSRHPGCTRKGVPRSAYFAGCIRKLREKYGIEKDTAS